MLKVAVIGSLSTYEISRLLPSSSFQVVLYLAQTRLAGLLGEGISLEPENAHFPSDLAHTHLSWDLNKNFREQLETAKPDLILINMLNERFDLIEYKGQYFTKTDLLSTSGLLDAFMPGHKILSPDESLAASSCLASEIGAFLNSVSRRIILHKSYCAKKRALGDLVEPFSEATIARANNLNQALDFYHDIFIKHIDNLITITSSPESAIADGERYGGEIPYVYSATYNTEVADIIENLPEIKWMAYAAWGRAFKSNSTPTASSSPGEALLNLYRSMRIEFHETHEPIPSQQNPLNIKQTLVRYAGNRYLYYAHRHVPGRPLLVVFSGVTATPGHNFMNYYKFMSDLNASVLFIPDTAGAHGCYYAMINGTHEIINTNLAIISKVMSDLGNSEHDVYLVGTSKGATAAIFHSLLLGFGNVIAGEPQIKIGDYLFDSKGQQFQSMIYTMTGRINPDDRSYLNSLLDQMASSVAHEYSGGIEIIVGDATDYFDKHVKYFVGSCDKTSMVDKPAITKVPLSYHGHVHIPFTERIYNLFGYL